MVNHSLRSYLLVASLAHVCVAPIEAAAADWKVIRNDFVEAAPAVAEVHASSIVEISGSKLLATWFGGTKEGNDDVEIWTSTFDGKKWSDGRVVADGRQPDGSRFPAWNPVLHRRTDGSLILFFRVGASPEKWWSEYMMSRDNGVTWSKPVRLPAHVLGPIKNKPIAFDGGILHPSSIEHSASEWVARIERSDENLKTWSSAIVPDPEKFGAIQPALLYHGGKRLQALARSNGRSLVETWSEDGGHTWSPVKSTGLYMANSGIDAVTLRAGGHLLVYNPSEKPANPKSWGERRPLVVAYSADGRSWQTVATIDHAPNRHGYAYPAIVEAADGRVHITYTWNRARLKHVILIR